MPAHHVLVLTGGQSDEHPISLLSARNIVAGLEAGGHRVRTRVITRKGLLLDETASALALGRGDAVTEGGEPLLTALERALVGVDLVFPVLHGPLGEDGTVQGLLRLVGMPVVGSSVVGSAVGMDKLMTKAVLASAGLPQVAYDVVRQQAFANQPASELARVLGRLRLPLFVKPANMGSSVGVSRVVSETELAPALELALRYDRRAICEQGLEHIREIECAVLGNDEPRVGAIGEITYQAAFYDYETKYTAGRAQMIIPAKVPAELAERCQAMAKQTFLALDCAGLARVDFFYQEASSRLYVNEINTMPGFTQFSMYPSMWQAAGLPLAPLLTELLELALARRP